MKKTLLRLIVVLYSFFAVAPVYAETIFQCTTTNNKVIKVVDVDKTIQYSFGKSLKTPEIALSIPRNKVTTYQWAGIGRDENYSIQIPNGKIVYDVFRSFDRSTRKNSAGINVMQDNEQLATVSCDMRKPIINKLEGIKLRSEF